MSKKRKLKFFESEAGLIAYITSEIIETLKDDLDKMQRSERQHYTNDDRRGSANRQERLSTGNEQGAVAMRYPHLWAYLVIGVYIGAFWYAVWLLLKILGLL